MKIALCIFLGVIALPVIVAGLMLGGVFDFLPSATINLAKVEVKLRLHDPDVEFGNVTFRYVDPVKQDAGKTYVCGLLRQRGGGWRLFLWSDYEGRRDLVLAGGGVQADLLIADICGGARR